MCTGTPCVSASVATVCLSTCSVPVGIPASARSFANHLDRLEGWIRPPSGSEKTRSRLPASYRLLVSDRAGNEERLAFVYDTDRVELLEKVGEIAYAPADSKNVKLPGIEQKFDGFDRNPFLAAFQAGPLTFLLVTVHLFFGKETSTGRPSTIDMNRRALETYGVARWCDLRRKSPNAYTRNIIALGDFNLPKAQPGIRSMRL